VSGNQFIFKVAVSLLLVPATYSKACLLLVLLFVMSELLCQAEFDRRWSNLDGMCRRKKLISHILKPTESQTFRKYISGCEQRALEKTPRSWGRQNACGRILIYIFKTSDCRDRQLLRDKQADWITLWFLENLQLI